jgi:lipoprotein-anchoring transpeptidase ErfK/SrfK
MGWSGTANVAYKREWQNWTPTQNMIARNSKTYKKWTGGMEDGSNNPLGARALYLFEGGEDRSITSMARTSRGRSGSRCRRVASG